MWVPRRVVPAVPTVCILLLKAIASWAGATGIRCLRCSGYPGAPGVASPGSSKALSPAARHWTADNGNGTYSNPLFYGEFEDPDMIRVGDDYYLVGTTMHMNPALEILHSKDLVNWELVGYCMDRLDFGPAFRLEGGNIYGRGIWAPCIRYHKGTFYIFSNINGVGLQVFRSKSIKGPWERNQLPGRHDLSVLFDDGLNKVFIISSAGNRGPDGSTTYPIEELTPDLKAFDTNAPKRQMVIPRGTRMGEGHHLYKINGKYYDISAIPGGPVDQMVARADSIDGPWEVTYMVQNESMGVTAGAPALAPSQYRGLWIHQGGMCDTPYGRMVVRDYVGPRQRRPDGFLGAGYLGRGLPADRPSGQSAQGAEHLDQTQHRIHPGAEANLCLGRGFRSRQVEPALAMESCAR